MSGDDSRQFVGKQLKRARVHEKYTQSELAEAIGISSTSISNYENGRQVPYPDRLEELAKELRFPVSFFRREEFGNFEPVIFWRALHGVSKTVRFGREVKARWLFHIRQYLANHIDFPEPNIPDLGFDDPFMLSLHEVEEIAEQVRDYWGLGQGPISNVTWLLENHGCIVSRLSLGCEQMDGFSFWGPDGWPYVILNTDKASAARSRFDAAHELAHLVLHQSVSRSDLGDGSKYKKLEAQAHRFAGAFLFPSESFIEECPSYTLPAFRDLKERWRVSIAMMVRRSKDLELIDGRQYKNLQVNISRKKWRKKEPLDNELTPERPELLGAAIRMLLEQRIVSREEILDHLPYGARRVELLTGLPRGILSGDNPRKLYHLDFKDRESDGSSAPANDGGEVISFPD